MPRATAGFCFLAAVVSWSESSEEDEDEDEEEEERAGFFFGGPEFLPAAEGLCLSVAVTLACFFFWANTAFALANDGLSLSEIRTAECAVLYSSRGPGQEHADSSGMFV